MSTSIPEVAEQSIAHALLVKLTLGQQGTYYLTNSYKQLQYSGQTYKNLGGFLQAGQIVDNIKTTSGDFQISLSGIPVDDENYLSDVLNAPIKGSVVEVYRAFFNVDTGIIGNTYLRFKGIITSYAIQEDVDTLSGDSTATVVISAASTVAILENKISGQRTNETDRKRFFPSDTIMDRVKDLHKVQFDFGREFNSSGGGGGGGGGGGRGGGRYRSVQR